jgi:hypothetical protein
MHPPETDRGNRRHRARSVNNLATVHVTHIFRCYVTASLAAGQSCARIELAALSIRPTGRQSYSHPG